MRKTIYLTDQHDCSNNYQNSSGSKNLALVYTINRVKPEKIKIIDSESKEEIIIEIYTSVKDNRTSRRMSIEASQRFKIEKVRDGKEN